VSLLIESWCASSNPCGFCACLWKRYSDTASFKFATGLPAWSVTVSYAPGAQVEYLEQPFQADSPTLGVNPVDAGYPAWTLLDTTDMPLDQAQLCAPYWGVAGIAVGSGHAPGDIVSGLFDVTLLGSWANIGDSALPTAPPALPPALHVIYQGVNVFTFDPSSGTIINFVATGNAIDRASGIAGGISDPTIGLFQNTGPGGVPIYGGRWGALARITRPGCVFLDTSNSHFLAPWNCVLPYTGPIPDPATVTQLTPSSDLSSTGPIIFSDFYDDDATPGVWVDSGIAFNLAQTASFLSPYYLHAH
jgi:hypothetical protein